MKFDKKVEELLGESISFKDNNLWKKLDKKNQSIIDIFVSVSESIETIGNKGGDIDLFIEQFTDSSQENLDFLVSKELKRQQIKDKKLKDYIIKFIQKLFEEAIDNSLGFSDFTKFNFSSDLENLVKKIIKDDLYDSVLNFLINMKITNSDYDEFIVE